MFSKFLEIILIWFYYLNIGKVNIYILINIGNARQFLEHQVYEHMRCSILDSEFYSFPDKENSKFWNRENSKAPRYEWRIVNLRNDRFQNREHVG